MPVQSSTSYKGENIMTYSRLWPFLDKYASSTGAGAGGEYLSLYISEDRNLE